MIYTFAHADYLLSVKKVRKIETPGCRKDARLIKVVFEVYRHVDEGHVIRCDEEPHRPVRLPDPFEGPILAHHGRPR